MKTTFTRVSLCLLSPLFPLLLLPQHTVSLTGATRARPAARLPITILSQTPNINSTKVNFAAVNGAVDYRAYRVDHGHVKKYSGGKLAIEINDLDVHAPEQPQYVIEALDAFGPYEYSDGATPHSQMHSINGRIANGAEPNVIARSLPFRPLCGPRYNRPTPGATVLFQEFWAGSTPFAEVPLPQLPAAMKGKTAFYGNPNTDQRFENARWTIDATGHAFGQTQVFVHPGAAHMMDWLEAGGSKSGNLPAHNNHASFAFQPKGIACDISQNKVAHLQFEVDAFFTVARWFDVWFIPDGEDLLNPGQPRAKRPITRSGNAVRLGITHNLDDVRVWRGNVMTREKSIGIGKKPYGFRRGEAGLNGDERDLDFRHRFDWYVSEAGFKVMEEGRVVLDQKFTEPLPFTRGKFIIVHRLYHTSLHDTLPLFRAKKGEVPGVLANRDLRHWGPVRIEQLSGAAKG